MYSLNPLMRNVLITTDEVVFHAPTKQTLDPRTIQNCIIIAEESFISPALGYAMYQDLLDKKNVEITTSNISTYQQKFDEVELQVGDIVNAYELLSASDLKLWKQHLWKLTAECVMLIAYPEGFVQFGSEGVVHNAPTAGTMSDAKVVTPELRSVKWAMDKKLMGRITPLTDALHNYICNNKGSHSLYNKPCPCDETTSNRKTDLILGLYDEKPNGCYD